MESDVLENSLIHLLDAASRLDETIPDIIYIKYAVEHLWNGIELLLADKLPDKTPPSARKEKDRQDLLKDRLTTYYGIDIDEYTPVLNKIRKDFHTIEEHKFMGSKVQITSNLVEVWPFVVDLISKHVELSRDAYIKNLFNQVCELMDSHLKFIRDRRNDSKSIMREKLKGASSDRPLKCPKCMQDAIPLLSNGNANFSCSFCGHIAHWKQLVVEYGSVTNDAGPFDCLDCASPGVLQTRDGWVCLSCCHEWALESIAICHSCGAELVPAQPGKPNCRHCLPPAD